MPMILAALLAVPTLDNAVYLNCLLPDRRNRTISWQLRLDEAAGVVDVSSDDPTMHFRSTAIYRPETIRFGLLDASFSIDRATGSIKRTLIEYGVAQVAEGICSPKGRPRASSKKSDPSQEERD